MKDIYKTYNAETLATDPDFIDWVKEEAGVDSGLWNDWLKKNPDSLALMKEAESIVRALDFSRLDTHGAAERIWDHIEESIEEKASDSNQGVRSIKAIRYYISAAAAGLALLLYFQFFTGSSDIIQTISGQDKIQSLPDASFIHLNDMSKVSYDSKSYTVDRTISLEGEAFFQVTKGAPFVVSTDQGSIEVLGTSFNVFSRKSGFEVRCFTGKVRVKSKESEVVLLPGQLYSTFSAKVSDDIQYFDQSQHQDWRQGFFSYQSAHLSDVLDEMARQYDVTITLDEGLSDIEYTGFFLEGALEEALYSVCWPLKLTWKIEGGKVEISQN